MQLIKQGRFTGIIKQHGRKPFHRKVFILSSGSSCGRPGIAGVPGHPTEDPEQRGRMEKNIADRELLAIFQRVQKLEPQQLFEVKDFLSAFILKADLQKNLAAK